MSRKLKIAVAEPSLIIRHGVIFVLKQIGALRLEISEIPEPEQIKSSLAWQKPDVLIVNPAAFGILSAAALRKDAGNPDLKCVALQASLMDAGAFRNYDETVSVYDTAEQIRDKILRLTSEPDEGNKRHEALSQREKEVVVCVIKGMTNKQIADKLCLSTHTIITHRRNISAKLDIHSTAGLTIYAIVNKLVDLDNIKDQSDEA